MEILQQLLFNLFINAIETFLIYLLLSNKLFLKSSFRLKLLCFSSQLIFVTLLNQFITSSSFQMIIIFIINISVALILSVDTVEKTIFWGGIYTIITAFADMLTVFLSELFIHNSLSSLIYFPYNIIMTFIYLLICVSLVILSIQKKASSLHFPCFLQILWFIFIIAGIAAIEFILDVLIQEFDFPSIYETKLLLTVVLLFLILFSSILLFHYIGVLYQTNLELLAENKQKQFEKQQFDILNNTNQILRTWKHDFQNHISVLKVMLDSYECDSASSYLNLIQRDIQKSNWLVHTGNNVLDAVLSSKWEKIQTSNISFTHNIFLPDIIPLNNLELTSLTGNLLDNAIEACLKISENDKRYIYFEIKPFNQFLYIDMTNSFVECPCFDETHHLISTKSETGHGIGLKRIKQIVTQVDGFLDISTNDSIFHITIVLPLKSRDCNSSTDAE